MADILSLLLEFRGHPCAVAHTEAQAVGLAGRCAPQVLVLGGMPMPHACEVRERIRALPGCQALFTITLARCPGAADAQAPWLHGADAYLPGAVDVDRVSSLIAVAADRAATALADPAPATLRDLNPTRSRRAAQALLGRRLEGTRSGAPAAHEWRPAIPRAVEELLSSSSTVS
ncbi:hypothetical protein [Ramlibacter rhizophilus]|uniref:Response regulator transcription factor n=1 Tax=Ramlibacter rhizophilus TaxID=1781167 RepID=A0A4Z0C1J7_9BURK|nr:hypothetical protein [Ramlibacter rhizophilus]TFZ04398.1 hypothetical protein EZ242_01175 [Ramlibacter rhizophilus]